MEPEIHIQIVKSPDVIRKHNTIQKSEYWLWKTQVHFSVVACEKQTLISHLPENPAACLI